MPQSQVQSNFAEGILLDDYHIHAGRVVAHPGEVQLAEAKKLSALVKKTELLYVLTHNYTGYPLVDRFSEADRNANKAGLLRRVNLDLTGLSPTPAEVSVFVNWLAHPHNSPLPRTLVNRVWRVFFGFGFVKVVDEFGIVPSGVGVCTSDAQSVTTTTSIISPRRIITASSSFSRRAGGVIGP